MNSLTADTTQTVDCDLAMVMNDVCRNGSVLDLQSCSLLHVLRVGDVRKEGNILMGEVYAAVKLTVTCEFIASQEARKR